MRGGEEEEDFKERMCEKIEEKMDYIKITCDMFLRLIKWKKGLLEEAEACKVSACLPRYKASSPSRQYSLFAPSWVPEM